MKSTAVFILLLSQEYAEALLSSPGSLRHQTRRYQTVLAATSEEWSPSSWRNKKVTQMPDYPDQEALLAAEQELKNCAPLVFAGEVRDLQEKLAKATVGQGFLLMGGDCAESFAEFNINKVRDSFRVILQMALILSFGGSVPVIKIGRMAGQFAKPRSSGTEVVNGVEIPSYRGDNVNREEATLEARTPDPKLMVEAYHQCTQTLNILRAFSSGGYADMSRLHAWNLDFVESTEEGSKYRELASKVDEALRFMKAIGVDTSSPAFTTTSFFTGHEALLLPYEEALTREDSLTGKVYDCSAHLLWIGERTRQLDGAHIEFCRGIHNPLGVKISDKCEPSELLELLDAVNPENVPGRVTVIVRMGAEKLRTNLPPLLRAVQRGGKHVLWCSDPVHGNTVTSKNGYKTRDFAAIRAELRAFFDVHEELGTHAGGFHVEMTGDDVTECLGGIADITEEDLAKRYTTHCDPRLNGAQSIELAFLVAQRMRSKMGLPPLTSVPVPE
mmetsp:Transcript_18745/g.37130  ORF Transcript_18745/g.37130 Transcript_18745/m.37130 type:complete len:500 (+) Transcript_18745:67-1566(+)